jgi:ABC-type transporter Mla maintaining outer membrane lipid asymmetry ATPase subunit MlaF
MPIVLEVQGLWKCYAVGVRGCSARVWVLRGATLTVRRGERVGLIGARGAGKTTLLHCLRGLRRPDAGAIHVAPEVRSDLLLLDEGESTRLASDRSRTAIVAARDVAELHGIVDRCVLLRDGILLPIGPPAHARRVAEGLLRDC